MYSDVEVVENDVFVRALWLLHSREDDSAEKLRNMLNASIENKLAIIQQRKKSKINSMDRRTEDIIRGSEDSTKSLDVYANDDNRVEITSTKEVGPEISEIAEDHIDVPRISIPDENSDSERVLCKICKGDRVGPLILLECQECQDTYHPLCHQPAVVEIDVYDPRLVWRCGACLEANDNTAQRLSRSSPFLVNLEDDETDNEDETEMRPRRRSRRRRHRRRHRCDAVSTETGLALEKIEDKETTKIRNRGITGSTIRNARGTRAKIFSAQLRKRVGSKRSWI